MSILQLSFLGPVQISHSPGSVIAIPARKEVALLAYLAIEERHAHSRERLAGLLWPDDPEMVARSNLRVVLSRLQSRLGDPPPPTLPYLKVNRAAVQFDRDSVVWVDSTAFASLLETNRRHAHQALATCVDCQARLLQAVTLYRGDFLEGFYLNDSPAFDEWAALQREGWRLQVLQGLTHLVEGFVQSEQWEPAHHFAQRQVTLDPLREVAYRQLMLILAHRGERSAALTHFNTLTRLLQSELGVEPEAATVALAEQIRSGAFVERGRQEDKKTGRQEERGNELLPVSPSPRSAELTSKPLPVFSPPPVTLGRHNLPATLTPFIGREWELAQLAERLAQPTYRLISLVGLGGIGKTRLALQAAQQQRTAFADGVYFVSLVGVQQAELVPATIIAALGLTLKANSKAPREQLLDVLRQKQLLLILDNLEHLLHAAGEPLFDDTTHFTITDLVLDILRAAPQVVLLVTSRERLALQAEDLFLLSGLPIPAAPDHGSASSQPMPQTISHAADFAALRLFAERAHRLHKHFSLTQALLPDIIRICRLVEGLPLAIELAVTWINTFSCAEIAHQLAQSIDLLATNERDVPAHHRTIRAVFQTSWQLLTAEEQRVLAQLAIFRGGFTLSAAETLTGATPALLARLVHQSLLRERSATRYEMHELLRQFAAERLTTYQADTQFDLANRHSEFYLTLVTQQQPALRKAKSSLAINTITADIDNLRAAWRWAIEWAAVASIAAASEGLARYYTLMGLVQEGEASFAEAAKRVRMLLPGGATTDQLARFLSFQVDFLLQCTNHQEAQDLATEALALARQGGNQGLVAGALAQIAAVFRKNNELMTARQYYQQAYEAAAQAGAMDTLLAALKGIGRIAIIQADSANARRYYEQALQLCDEQQLHYDKSWFLNDLGQLYYQQGEFVQAQHCFQEALALGRQIGLRRLEGFALDLLGTTWDRLGDFSQATHCYHAALAIQRQVGELRHCALILGNLGISADYCGNYEQALHFTQQALQLELELKMTKNLPVAQMNLSLHYHHLGDDVSADHYVQMALELAQRTENRISEAYAWTIGGHALVGLDNLAAAAHAYQQALTIYQEAELTDFMPEPWAGLARVALAQGDSAQAYAWVRNILHYTGDHALDAAEEPGRVYLTCYQVLQQRNDPQAAPLLQSAYATIQTRAAKISDATMRHTFLQNIAAHRTIIAEVERRQSAKQSNYVPS